MSYYSNYSPEYKMKTTTDLQNLPLFDVNFTHLAPDVDLSKVVYLYLNIDIVRQLICEHLI